MKAPFVGGFLCGALVVVLAGCAPQRPYRVSQPPTMRAPAPATATPAPPAPPSESFRKPLPQDPNIHEQSLESAMLPPPLVLQPTVPSVESEAGVIPEGGSLQVPPLADDSSLLAKITPGVTPQRAASLRLTDEGSKLLEAGEPGKALNRLERTIVIDSTNPYGYFYLAKAHHRLGRHRESLNFLDVAERRLSGELFWLAEVHALRGENYRALGQLHRARESYVHALRLNSGNRTATEALLQLEGEAPSASR